MSGSGVLTLSRRAVLVPILLASVLAGGCAARAERHGSDHRPAPGASQTPAAPSPQPQSASHLEYVFSYQTMSVYDIDHGQQLLQQTALPVNSSIRGAGAVPQTHMLYVSYGGDSGPRSRGSLLKYDLLKRSVVWNRTYARGIDSFAISRNGTRIYMPDGELSSDGIWTVLDSGSGDIVGRIHGGLGPHNTVAGISGRRVYLGGRNYAHLDVASTATNRLIRRIGPLRSGVRPFTVNGRETIAYTTATGFLGFQVSSISTGRVLYTQGFGRRFKYNPAHFAPSAPSHGISLSPDERQLWVIDGPNSYVHVFDVSRVPRHPPRRIADIRLRHRLTGDASPCGYDCRRDGWLRHSRSGCLVYVGDSGDVLSTRTFSVVGFLPALHQARVSLEIDWAGGVPVATTTRTGLGYVKGGQRPARPRCP